MLRRIVIAAVAVCALGTVHIQAQKNEFFRPKEVWNDTEGNPINAHGGGILYHKGTYYWYGEYKVGKTVLPSDATWERYRTDVTGVSCYSSKDLLNWKFEGVALKAITDDPNSDIHPTQVLERPKVVYNKKTGKYVMWFHLELKGKGYGSAYAGVATATKPTGPFKFLKAGRVNPGKWPLNMDKKDQTAEFTKEMPDYVRIIRRDYPGGQMSRDMTIFVDDNGKAYHIYSSEGNITLHIAELTPDYTGHTGKYVRAFINRYMEAPAICKHKGKYYLIASGCTGWAPNAARSAVAKNIAGPWMELKNPCVGPKAGITFGGQSTFILPVQGKPGKFIFMADIWRPKNAIDGRYLWLPMKWEGDQIILEWKDEWTLDDL